MASIKDQQQLLNTWTKRYVPSLTPLTEDGSGGPLTGRRISEAKWFIGLPDHRDGEWSTDLEWLLDHPGKTKDGVIGPDGLRRGSQRRAAQKAQAQKAHDHATNTNGLVTLDGKSCSGWVAQYVVKVREAGRWKGSVVSGYRTPAHSESLCYRMCGAPSCPGRCAGRSTNHAHFGVEQGAVDVSDYVTFGAECRRLGLPLHNVLGAADPVHFSYHGN